MKRASVKPRRRQGRPIAAVNSKRSFDAKSFLSKVGDGKTVSNIENTTLFSRRVTPQMQFFTSRAAR
jgi:hypothetical protein